MQHYFTKARTSFIYDSLFTAAGVEEKAHILSRTRPHAADFLQAPATSHTKQSNPEFSVSLCLYLYEDLQRVLGLQPGKKYLCPCLQSTFIPTARKQFSLSHAVNCCHDGSLIKRHNSVLYAMIRCAEVVGVTLTPEVRVSPANSLRFDAVGQGLLPNQSSNVLIECSIVNPLKSDYVNTASKKPFYACQEVCKIKKAKYQDYIHEGDVFLPCIFEAFGASLPNGVSALLDSLSARCKHRPPPDATRYAPSFKSWAYQQISSALWLSNARNCLRLAGLIRSNHYAVFDNPVNATTVDDYIPAANASAAPVADAMFVTQDVTTPVHTPALPASAPALSSSAPALPAPAMPAPALPSSAPAPAL